ncbi:MAG: hypothetical protein ACOC71_04665 [Hyphomicrobiales bacterium]
MSQKLLPALLPVLVTANAVASAAEMEAVPVTVVNAGTERVNCQVEIAHWFSAELASIAPGRDSSLDIWRDPATGSHATRNEHGEFLPVERAWCGIEGRAYVTRWQITLPPAMPRRLTCAGAGEKLDCR